MGKPKSAVRAEFAKRLKKALYDKGWIQSDPARHASKFMKGNRPERDNISSYMNERSLPNAQRFHAMAQALGVKPTDPLPDRGTRIDNNVGADTALKDMGDGRTWIHVNQETTWAKAIEVMRILKGDPIEDE